MIFLVRYGVSYNLTLGRLMSAKTKAQEKKGKGRKTGEIISVLLGIFAFICSGKRELYFVDADCVLAGPS